MPETADHRQYLSFDLAGSSYAVPILRVREILQIEAVTRIPSVPVSIRGVINLRGSVVPVVDLARKLGLRETPVTRRTCILIVETGAGPDEAVVGILADSVSEVVELSPSDVEPVPSFGTGVRAGDLLGMGKLGKGFVLLLDLDRALAAPEASPPAAAAAT